MEKPFTLAAKDGPKPVWKGGEISHHWEYSLLGANSRFFPANMPVATCGYRTRTRVDFRKAYTLPDNGIKALRTLVMRKSCSAEHSWKMKWDETLECDILPLANSEKLPERLLLTVRVTKKRTLAIIKPISGKMLTTGYCNSAPLALNR